MQAARTSLRPEAQAEDGHADTVTVPRLHGAARGGLQVDLRVVDAIVNAVARTALAWGAVLRRLQTGTVTHYAAAMIGGVLAAMAVYSVVWAG